MSPMVEGFILYVLAMIFLAVVALIAFVLPVVIMVYLSEWIKRYLEGKRMINIIFDNSCLCWNKGMDYNLMFVIHLIDNYKKVYGLHCLNDIYDDLGITRIKSGFDFVWDGPIEMTYEEFNDHIVINIITEPMKEDK